MSKPVIIGYQSVKNTKTDIVHYASKQSLIYHEPFPICLTDVREFSKDDYRKQHNCKRYIFTEEKATCKRCTKNDAHWVRYAYLYPRVGFWIEQIVKAQKIMTDRHDPFELFANKHGFSLKKPYYHRLYFPKTALEFKEYRRYKNDFFSQTNQYWNTVSDQMDCLPTNVFIRTVNTEHQIYHDKVAIGTSQAIDFIFDWELITPIKETMNGGATNLSK